jgi:hypothetical protein
MYFESVVNYWMDNPDDFKPPRIQVKRHLLVRGYTYTEAEAVSVEWGTKETEEEIKISPIRELSLYTVIEDDPVGKLSFNGVVPYTYTTFYIVGCSGAMQ